MKTYSIFIFALISTSVFSQYTYPEKEYSEEIKNRILAVQLLEGKNENERSLNNALKTAFLDWTLTPVEFKSWEQMGQIIDKNNTQYAILMQEDELRNDIRMRRVDEKGKKTFLYVPKSGRNYYSDFSFAFHNFTLVLPMKKKLEEVTAIGFANSDLSASDYSFLLQQLNLLVNNSLNDTPQSEHYNIVENLALLKDYKLILLQDFFKEKDIPKIADVYENEYGLVDFTSYQDIILNKNENTCYSKFIWSNQAKTYVLAIVDSSNGRILAQVEFDKNQMKKEQKAEGILSHKDIEAIVNLRIQKGNNYYR